MNNCDRATVKSSPAWRRSNSAALGGEPARASSKDTLTSRCEKAWESTGIYEIMSPRKANPIPASSTTSRRPSAVCGRTSPMPRVKKVVPLPYRVVPKPAPPPVATNGALRPHRSRAKPPINPVAHTPMSRRSANGPWKLKAISQKEFPYSGCWRRVDQNVVLGQCRMALQSLFNRLHRHLTERNALLVDFAAELDDRMNPLPGHLLGPL